MGPLLLRDCPSSCPKGWPPTQASNGWEHWHVSLVTCHREWSGPKWQWNSRFLSVHQYGVVLRARKGLLCGDKYLFPFSFAPSICTGSRELMEGQGRGGENCGFSTPPTHQQLRHDRSYPRDGVAFLLLLFLVGWFAHLLQPKSDREKTS